jgi:hypothetical protein
VPFSFSIIFRNKNPLKNILPELVAYTHERKARLAILTQNDSFIEFYYYYYHYHHVVVANVSKL